MKPDQARALHAVVEVAVHRFPDVAAELVDCPAFRVDAEAEGARGMSAAEFVVADLEVDFRPGNRSIRCASPVLPGIPGERRSVEPIPCRAMLCTDSGLALLGPLPVSGHPASRTEPDTSAGSETDVPLGPPFQVSSAATAGSGPPHIYQRDGAVRPERKHVLVVRRRHVDRAELDLGQRQHPGRGPVAAHADGARYREELAYHLRVDLVRLHSCAHS